MMVGGGGRIEREGGSVRKDREREGGGAVREDRERIDKCLYSKGLHSKCDNVTVAVLVNFDVLNQNEYCFFMFSIYLLPAAALGNLISDVAGVG